MLKCSHCGGRLRRVHRTVLERFRYAAVYYCKGCDNEECLPRIFQYHFGVYARCPQCGTHRLSKLRERDKIDKMNTGLLNLAERIWGGNLYHCRYCRLQFYDRRIRLSDGPEEPVAAEAAGEVTPEVHQAGAGGDA
jgi:uncharacterized protein with PIN domain